MTDLKEPSIVKIRQALDVHPWAANLPTILMSHERAPREKYVGHKVARARMQQKTESELLSSEPYIVGDGSGELDGYEEDDDDHLPREEEEAASGESGDSSSNSNNSSSGSSNGDATAASRVPDEGTGTATSAAVDEKTKDA